MTEDIKEACEVMAAGDMILYPTDIVWGIGCDAADKKAVQRVYKLERRADNKAMLVLTDSEVKLDRYTPGVPDIAQNLIGMSDKPLAIICSSARNLTANLLGADSSVGIHITNEEFSKRLCKRLRRPLVSISANVSNKPPPTNLSGVSEVVKEGMDYIASYRQGNMSRTAPPGIIKSEANGLVQVTGQG